MRREKGAETREDFFITPRVRAALTEGLTGPSGVGGRAMDRALARIVQLGMRYALSHGATQDEADDVAQQLAVTVWERRVEDPDFLGKAETPEEQAAAIAFVMAVVRNTLGTDRRRERREGERAVVHAEERTANVAHSLHPARSLEDSELHWAQAAALAKLDPFDRQALYMKADGFSYRQIAAHTGRSESAAKSAVFRAREALRAHCEAHGIPIPTLRRERSKGG